jgi:signal peptidase I
MSSFLFMCFLVSRLIFITPFLVEGQSMEPTMKDREIFLIDRNIHQGDIKRGDIIVFSFDGQYYYVKRVIGMPGDTIRTKDDQVDLKTAADGVYKNLLEPYLAGKKFYYGDERFFLVPESDQYFVMGDNRAHSKDSRSFSYPFVKLDQIYGRYIYP